MSQLVPAVYLEELHPGLYEEIVGGSELLPAGVGSSVTPAKVGVPHALQVGDQVGPVAGEQSSRKVRLDSHYTYVNLKHKRKIVIRN